MRALLLPRAIRSGAGAGQPHRLGRQQVRQAARKGRRLQCVADRIGSSDSACGRSNGHLMPMQIRLGARRRLGAFSASHLIAVCAVSGALGWTIWTLILCREMGQDWMVFHTAAKALLDGDPGLVFDGARLTDTINATYRAWLSAPLNFHPWLYPPSFLLFILPFASLPFGWSYAAFSLLTFIALVAVVWHLTGRSPIAGAALLLFPQTAFAFLTGQNSFLTGTLIVGAFGLLERRPLLAGVLTGLVTYKPQLFLMIPVALVAGRKWRTIAAALLTVVALFLFSLALFGVGLWREWLQVMLAPSDTYREWLAAGRQMGQSVFSCAAILGAPPALANAVQLVGVVVGCGCVYRSYSRPVATDLRICILLAATLLAAPHVSSQDGVLLAVGTILLFCARGSGGAGPAERLVIAAAWVAELFDPPAIFRLGTVTPLVIVAFIAVTLRRAQQSTCRQPAFSQQDKQRE